MQSRIVAEILIWIDENIGLISNARVAEKSGYSLFHFQRIFKRVTGITLGAYVYNKKMDIACHRLLDPNETILHIALSLGYSSQHAFHRSFKKCFNMSPGAFRKNNMPLNGIQDINLYAKAAP